MSKLAKTEIAERTEQPVVVADASSIMAVISRAAADPNTDVDKLERLTALYERITARNSEQSFNAAMTAAQTEMRPVAADANNPQTRSKYASYVALDRSLRPIYTKHGFSMTFGTADGGPESYVRVVCDLGHEAGYSRRYHVDMPADGKGAKGGDVMTKTHATGAALTYGQRYLLKMIFNIAVGPDDDGNSVGATSKISDEQLRSLIDLCDEVEADKRKFCEFMGVTGLAEITVKELPRAIRALNDKKAKRAVK